MRWQRLAIPCAVTAALAACGGKADTGETGAVPGTPMDSTSMSNPASDPAMTPAAPADSSPAGTTDTSAVAPK